LIGVAIVAGTRLYREGIAHALRGDEHLEVVATLPGRPEDIEQLGAARPDVVIVDVASGGDLEALRAVKRAAPTSRVVVLGIADDEDAVIACAEVGVAGYVEAQAGIDELTDVVRAAVRGEAVCSPRLAGALLRRIGSPRPQTNAADSPLERLTIREHEILDLIDEGLSNKEIGRELNIELGTVKAHVHNLLDKLGVQRRAHASARRRELEAQLGAVPGRRRAGAGVASKI
jgi:two-component system, NarL family, nitrate/nitrite response regulator NarL